MEWVQTTGRTVEQAKGAALEQLGVAEDDAEFEVLEEPRLGLFGRMRGEARVRARIRPRQQRPKPERRDRRRRSASDGSSVSDDRSAARERTQSAPPEARSGGPEVSASVGVVLTPPLATPTGASIPTATSKRRRAKGGGSGRGPNPGGASQTAPLAEADEEMAPQQGADDHRNEECKTMDATARTLEEQAADAEAFLGGLLEAFGLDGSVSRTEIDDQTVEISIHGGDLGLLIGPKGQTIQALHEVVRTVAHRGGPPAGEGRIRVDVAGYRERRRAALERFASQVAESVRASGTAKALEPMTPPDRKVVHDVINGIDGVETTSEGEEPRRRVIVRPVQD